MKIFLGALSSILVASTAFAQTSNGGSIPGQQVKKPQLIASYAGGPIDCGSLGGTKIRVENVSFAEVYYYAEFPERIWVYIGSTDGKGGDYLLGQDASCWFSTVRTSPLN